MLLHKNYTLSIVDDHPIVIEGLKSLLKTEPQIHTLSFTSGELFIEFIKENTIDVVLLDIMLPGMNGMEVCRQVKSISPETVVIGISNQAERSIIMQMLENGANGYVLKNADAEELLKCIDEALGGQLSFSEEVKKIMAKPVAKKSPLPAISRREKQILQHIADGRTTQQIAADLFISPLTVETHRRNLLQKFEVKNVAELIKVAVKFNLI